MYAFLRKQLEPLSLLTKTAKFIATLIFALLLMVLYLLFTSHGAQMALRLAASFTPYQITFTDVKGTLTSHLDMIDLDLKGPQINIQAEQIAMGWRFVDLFKPGRSFEFLNAKKLTISVNNSGKVKTDLSTDKPVDLIQTLINSAFPLPIQIDNIHLQDANIHWNKNTHHLNEFILKRHHQLGTVEEIGYQGAWGKLHATLHQGIHVEWNLDLAKSPYWQQHFPRTLTTQGKIVLPKGLLEDPNNRVQFNLQAKEFRMDRHIFQNFSLKLKGSLSAHQGSVQGIYDKIPLETRFSGAFANKTWQGKIFRFNTNHSHWKNIGNTTGTLALKWNDKILNSEAKLHFSEKFPLHLQLSMGLKPPFALAGTIQGDVNHVKSLSPLVPFLANVGGKLNIDLKLAGNASEPTCTGLVTLKDAKIKASFDRSKPILSQLQFILSEKNKVVIKGQGSWGDGQFSIDGNGAFGKNAQLLVKLKGEKLLISDTPEYRIIANPSLNLSLKNGVPLLEGSIQIPEAQIKNLKSQEMITPSQDVVIISGKKAIKRTATRHFGTIATHVDIILGDKITYKGQGFTTNVMGKLHIKQEPSQLPTAKGKLVLQNGKYRAYGKTFDIVYGQILFTGGPIDDPILDVRAQRKIQTNPAISFSHSGQPIVVGMKFSSNLKTPKIEFYSTPSMSDPDIISYLVVGRPQREVNHAQAELLLEAVSQLASVVGKNSRHDVQFDLAERLKLDQIGFSKKTNAFSKTGNNPLEDTVLVLGKQLSDRLYLHYSLGLLDTASQLGLRYSLGKNVTIEAQTGTSASSADVLLSFEGH